MELSQTVVLHELDIAYQSMRDRERIVF